jgi:outer membrane usher protein
MPIALVLIVSAAWATSHESQRAIFTVEVNGESKGEMFIRLAEDTDDVFLEIGDYTRLGLGFGESEGMVQIGGAPFISLAALKPRLKYEIDDSDLSLRIIALPEFSGVNRYPGFQGPAGADFLDGSSIFLNYDLDFYHPPDSATTDTVLSHELGFRKGRVLALSSFTWRRGTDISDYRRLQTQVIVDYRRSLRRLTVLDTVATSGLLGSTVSLLGASLAREFAIDPYFVRHPMPDLAGSVLTSSEIEIYQDGFLKSRYHVQPGEFQIEDLPISGIGVGSYDVVIRDAFGRETSLAENFYLARSLLRNGLHSYNYGIGLQRENTFDGDPEYGDPVLIGQHRYGLNSFVTAGGNLEISPDVYSAGLTADFKIDRFGVINLGASFGSGDTGSGAAAYLAYSYNAPRYSTNLLLRTFADGYTNLQRQRLTDPVRFVGVARFSFRASKRSSLSLNVSRLQTTGGAETFRPGLTYNQRINPMLSLIATYTRETRRMPDGLSVHDNIAFAGLHFFLPQRISVDVTHSSDGSSSHQSVSAHRNVPLQEGYGYRVALERAGFDGADDEIRPSGLIVYNGPVGTYRAEYDRYGGEPSWHVGTAGSLALVENSLFASRPLQQSFAVVRTGSLENVRVEYNGEPAGRTRSDGRLLVPNLRPYEVNKLAIQEEDLPLDYHVEKYEREIIPAPRSGAIVDFGLQRMSAIFGRLVLLEQDRATPLEHMSLAIDGMAADLSWRSGLDGEFYLENIPSGGYDLLGMNGDRRYRCPIVIPADVEALFDLGEVHCEPVP